MIHVIATIELAPGERTDFLREFRALVPQVRDEDGCIEYGAAIDLATSLPAQPEVRDDTVLVIEKWRDLAALEAHLLAPHMLSYRQRVKELVVATRLQVLEPVN